MNFSDEKKPKALCWTTEHWMNDQGQKYLSLYYCAQIPAGPTWSTESQFSSVPIAPCPSGSISARCNWLWGLCVSSGVHTMGTWGTWKPCWICPSLFSKACTRKTTGIGGRAKLMSVGLQYSSVFMQRCHHIFEDILPSFHSSHHLVFLLN